MSLGNANIHKPRSEVSFAFVVVSLCLLEDNQTSTYVEIPNPVTADVLTAVHQIPRVPSTTTKSNNEATRSVSHACGSRAVRCQEGGEKRNIVMSGDGIGKTIIVSSLSNSSGSGIGVSAALTTAYWIVIRGHIVFGLPLD
ncbi:hypothetical protein Q3G72_026309 [Acer saccharum]|nr:hypothetical protein Q3G72_026309 [Acer saccharum]